MSKLNTASAKSLAPPRRRGAPLGNRNAVTHGRRTAEATRARAADRARINGRLTTLANGFPPRQSREGGPPSSFFANKPNNSVAAIAPPAQQKKRGAPKGNCNALKHGLRSAEMTRLRRETRLALAKLRFLTRLAWQVVQLRAMEKKAAKRHSTTSHVGDTFPLSEALASLAVFADLPGKFLQDAYGPDG